MRRIKACSNNRPKPCTHIKGYVIKNVSLSFFYQWLCLLFGDGVGEWEMPLCIICVFCVLGRGGDGGEGVSLCMCVCVLNRSVVKNEVRQRQE